MFITGRLANFCPFSLCSWHINYLNEIRMWNKNFFHCDLIWASRHPNSSSLSQTALLLLEIAWLHRMESFIPSMIKQTIYLSNSRWNQSVHHQSTSHIFVNSFHQIRDRYSYILLSFFRSSACLIASIFLLIIFLNKDKDFKWKSSNNIF